MEDEMKATTREARQKDNLKLLNEIKDIVRDHGYSFTGMKQFSPEQTKIRFQKLIERDPFYVDAGDGRWIGVLNNEAHLYRAKMEAKNIKEVKAAQEPEISVDIMSALGLEGYVLPAQTKRQIKRKPDRLPQTYPSYSLRKDDAGRLNVYFSEGQVPAGEYLFAFKDKEIVLLTPQHIIDKVGALPRPSEYKTIFVIDHTVSKRAGGKKDHRGTRMTPAMRAHKAYIDSDSGWEPGDTLPAELVVIDGGYKIICPHLRKA
jgi:hypothetical protein